MFLYSQILHTQTSKLLLKVDYAMTLLFIAFEGRIPGSELEIRIGYMCK